MCFLFKGKGCWTSPFDNILPRRKISMNATTQNAPVIHVTYLEVCIRIVEVM